MNTQTKRDLENEVKIGRNGHRILKLNRSVYRDFEEGTHIVKIIDCEIFDREDKTFIKFKMRNQDGGLRHFTIMYNQESSSIFSKIAKAVFQKEKKSEVISEEFVDEVVKIKVERKGEYLNIVDASKVNARSDINKFKF